MAGFLDNIPVFSDCWKTVVATPVKFFNKSTGGTIDKVANGLIGFVGQIFPSWGAELAKQWDSDMGYDRKGAIIKAMQIIKDNNNKIALNQLNIDRLNASLQNLNQTAARATNKFRTSKALNQTIRDYTKEGTKLSAIGTAAANALGDINANSSMTTGEMNRRIKTVSDLMDKYEKGNNQ